MVQENHKAGCRHVLASARIGYPPEKIEQVRSIAKFIFPDLQEFNDTTEAPLPNTR